MQLATDNPALLIPKELQVPEGSTAANFTVKAEATGQDHESTIVATTGESTQAAQITVQGIKPASLSCAPKQVEAGGAITCEVRLNSDQSSQILSLAVTSSSQNLLVPATVTTRPRQSSLTFEADATTAAGQETVTIRAALGEDTVEDEVILLAASRPVLNLPDRQLVKTGTPLSFTVAATTASGVPAVLFASRMPSGASFDPSSGRVTWTPSQAQASTYEVSFAAQDPAGASSTGSVRIEVDAGTPVITAVVNGATQLADSSCSPGAIALLRGKWLTAEDSSWSDPTGASTALGGVRVKVNSTYAPVLSASRTQVQFLCPVLAPGTTLAISLETGSTTTKPLTAVLQDTAPGIFTWNGSGSGQSYTVFAGSNALAVTRSYRVAGQPAQPGDHLLVRVTGLRPEDTTTRPFARLGGVYAEVESMQAVPGVAGVYEVGILVPAATPVGDAIPLVVEVAHADGRITESNTATITVEAVRQ